MPGLIELEDIEANVKLCNSLGLSFVELNMSMPEYQADRMEPDKLIYLKEKYNIFYTIHLPEEFDIANINKDVRAAYLKLFTDTVRIAAQLKCPILNMHMNTGVYFTLPSRKIYMYDKYFYEYIDAVKTFGVYANELLNTYDIKLCVENTGIYNMDFIQKAVDALLEHSNIFLTWDIGHDHSSGCNDIKYIMDNSNKLRHMHIHDAIGEKHHLPLFTGEIDIIDRINVARENRCFLVIETKTVDSLKKSVEKLIKRDLY
jgi:sugar phosphate isomerase/epimerase